MAEHARPARTPTPETPSAFTPASTTRVSLPAAEFALADLFERLPDARVEWEPAVANPDDHALLIVRTEGREYEVDAALRTDPNIVAIDRFGGRSEGRRYRVTWEGRPRRLIQQLVGVDATLLSVRGEGGQWMFRVVTPEREGISRVYEVMDEFGCGADCLSISDLDGGHSHSRQSEPTDDQREALITAFEMGYHEIPRDVTTQELAEELGISHQALSERLRRGYKRLVKNEFITTDDEDR